MIVQRLNVLQTNNSRKKEWIKSINYNTMSGETKSQIFNSLKDFNELLRAAHVEIITNQRLSFKKKIS